MWHQFAVSLALSDLLVVRLSWFSVEPVEVVLKLLVTWLVAIGLLELVGKLLHLLFRDVHRSPEGFFHFKRIDAEGRRFLSHVLL